MPATTLEMTIRRGKPLEFAAAITGFTPRSCGLPGSRNSKFFSKTKLILNKYYTGMWIFRPGKAVEGERGGVDSATLPHKRTR